MTDIHSCSYFCERPVCVAHRLKELLADLRLNHEYCPKEVILQAADVIEHLVKEHDTTPQPAAQAEPNESLRSELEAVRAALELSHEHMQLYLPHYKPRHNVFEAVSAVLFITKEQSK